MASELKLSGSAAGRIIVQGNDTITTDQTFTFPATGGTLAIASTNSGGQPVPGYQQGTWTPQIPSANTSHTLWRRIGNSVMVQAFIGNIGTGLGANDTLEIKGLPYPIDGQALGSAMAENFNILITACFGLTDMIKLYSVQSGSSWINAKGSNRSNNSANAWFSIEYRTDNTDWSPKNSATVDS